jgi:hypothetical protein
LSDSASPFTDARDNHQFVTIKEPVWDIFGSIETATLPQGAEIRILVVTTGYTAKSQGEVIIYPESPGYAVNPVARWPFVKNGQVLTFRVVQHAGGRFYIQAGTPSPYLRADSCTRHADYDQLTFDKGWILNVKVLHEFEGWLEEVSPSQYEPCLGFARFPGSLETGLLTTRRRPPLFASIRTR